LFLWHLQKRDTPRFVVTGIPRAMKIYPQYCKRSTRYSFGNYGRIPYALSIVHPDVIRHLYRISPLLYRINRFAYGKSGLDFPDIQLVQYKSRFGSQRPIHVTKVLKWKTRTLCDYFIFIRQNNGKIIEHYRWNI
jgi:hypothetical protein